MWNFGKRSLALALALVMLLGLLPAGSVRAAEETAAIPTEAAYAEVDAIFDLIDAAEAAPAKKSATLAEKTEAAMALVMASESYVDGSLEQSGICFTWWTDDGIRCIYNPRMRQLQKNMTPETGIDAIVNEPVATKGGVPAGNQVYLVGPYYGYDNSFTNQYKNEARQVAQAIGDTDGYTLYSGQAATIDKVAQAVQSGAVVFFDSHGATDYQNEYDEYDCITGASGSWLCLTSKTGLTDQDYDDGAAYDGENVFVNGDVIANHMTADSPNGLLWMAICYGMGTDTMYKPLREKGVEVVYGYSESVTFAGDYLYEETFWGEMRQGKTVAEAVATMKATWGDWDWSTKIAMEYGYYNGYATLSAARADFAAFPWVVSSEDTHPGQRSGSSYGADSLQTVTSTYSLGEISAVTNPTDPGAILEEAYALSPGEELPYEATLTGVITQVYTAYNATYGNVTVIMAVPGYESMPIKCYRLSGSGADQIGVGDTITVTGTIVNYQHSSGDTEVEFAQGCTLDSWSSGSAADPEPETPALPTVLTADTEIEMTLTEDLYIDLAGYDLTGILYTNGFKVYCKDSSTDSYDCQNIGYFNCLDENGEWIAPELLTSDGSKHYLTVSGEEGYSFHRFFVGVTYMSLEPEVVGLGYKAELHGDDMVMAQLDGAKAFTFRLQLEGYNPVYRYFGSDELVSGDPITLRIRNYDVENYSEHALYAQVSLKLLDGTTIETEEVSLTFRWLTEQVDANHTQYTQEQLTQFQALLQQFEIVSGWDLPNLFPTAEIAATLDLSDTANRLSLDSTRQVWSANGIELTNNKKNSSTAVADYAPVRLYAGSEVIIASAGMTKLVFNCAGISAKYVTNLYDSLCAISGAQVTLDDTTITVVLSAATDSVTFTMTAQGRAAALTVCRPNE